MVSVVRVVIGNDETRIENDHDKMTLNSIDNCIDLLAEPLISFWVILRLKVLKTPSLGVCLRPRKIGPDRFVNHFPDGLAGQSRFGLRCSINRLIDISNRSVHSVHRNTSVLMVNRIAIASCRGETAAVISCGSTTTGCAGDGFCKGGWKGWVE